MISDKIVPSFYLIELHGAAPTAIFGDFGIEQLSLGSCDFNSDLEALHAMNSAVNKVLQELPPQKFTDETDFNPEFFPSINAEENEELLDAQAQADAIMLMEEVDENKVALVLSSEFDPLGDFVQLRRTLEGDNFLIIGRTAANFDEYVRLRSVDQLERRSNAIIGGVSKPKVH